MLSKVVPPSPFHGNFNRSDLLARSRPIHRKNLETDPPTDPLSVDSNSELAAQVLRYKTFSRRFGAEANVSKNALRALAKLDRALNNQIFGQGEVIEHLVAQAGNYLATGNTTFVSLAGYTRTGKTSLAIYAAHFLGLPWNQIDLGDYSATESSAASELREEINGHINRMSRQEHTRSVLVINELDKLRDKNDEGHGTKCPALQVINSLCDGRLGSFPNLNALVIFTYNLREGLYGTLHNHPDITTIEDMCTAHTRTLGSPTLLNSEIGKLFLEHTRARQITYTIATKPLDRASFEQLINRCINDRIASLKLAEQSIQVITSSSFREYLLQEAVVPAEQGQRPIGIVKQVINNAFLKIMANLPKIGKSDFRIEPLEVLLDYDSKSGELVYFVRKNAKPTAKELIIRGNLPLKSKFTVTPVPSDMSLNREQLTDGVMQAGRMWISAHFGVPFSFGRSDRIDGSVPPFIKSYAFTQLKSVTLTEAYAHMFVRLAGRASVRAILSPKPDDRELSYRLLSDACDEDIQEATNIMADIIGKQGLDEHLGPVVLASWHPRQKPIESLNEAQKLDVAARLRTLEDHLVEIIRKHQTQSAWIEQAQMLARQKRTTEKEYYQLIGAKHHSVTTCFCLPKLDGVGFDSESTKDLVKASKYVFKATGMTASDFLNQAIDVVKRRSQIGFAAWVANKL